MGLQKMVADHGHAKYVILIVVMVTFASVTAACQPNHTN